MNELKSTFPQCYDYLNSIEVNWQLYKAHEKGILLHDRKTNNIAECINGWLLVERFQSVFFFIKSTYTKLVVNLFNFTTKINKDYNPICSMARTEYKKISHQYDLSIRQPDYSYNIQQINDDTYQLIGNKYKENNKCGKIVTLSPSVTCSCDIWQQDHNPYKHLIAVLKIFD